MLRYCVTVERCLQKIYMCRRTHRHISKSVNIVITTDNCTETVDSYMRGKAEVKSTLHASSVAKLESEPERWSTDRAVLSWDVGYGWLDAGRVYRARQGRTRSRIVFSDSKGPWTLKQQAIALVLIQKNEELRLSLADWEEILRLLLLVSGTYQHLQALD